MLNKEDKNKFYKLFESVTKTKIKKLNEDVTDEQDELYWNIKSDVIKDFARRQIFQNGIPARISGNILGTQVEYVLDKENIQSETPDQNVLNYNVNYNTNYSGNNIGITLPIEVVVDMIKTDTLIGFKAIPYGIAKEIELSFN